MRANDVTSEEKPERRPERSEKPTLTFIRRLPAAVFEQAEQTVARAVAGVGSRLPPRMHPDRGRLYLHSVPVFHRHDLRTHRSGCSRRRRCTPHYPSRGVNP